MPEHGTDPLTNCSECGAHLIRDDYGDWCPECWVYIVPEDTDAR